MPVRRSACSRPVPARRRRPLGPRSRVVPLSEARFAVQLTASKTLRDKLERARDLMRHRNPSGDLAVVVEKAVDELLAKLDKERRPRVEPRPRARARAGKPGNVSRAVRREVFARDEEQCTFRDASGTRCPSRRLLEIDHVTPKALGGSDEISNLRIRCRAHNRLHAEDTFGKEHVAHQIDVRRRRSRSAVSGLPSLEFAMRGLVHLGFPERDARRALDALARRHAIDIAAVPIEQLLREAVASLT